MRRKKVPLVPFQPDTNLTDNVLNMSDWLDARAGKHGFVQMNQERFVFEDGTEVKFWEVNFASGWAFVEKMRPHSGQATWLIME